MATPYKLSDWNTLIDRINQVLQNPPAGTSCQPLPPIPHATDPRRWSWPDDVKVAQDKLRKACSQDKFTNHKYWEQSIIDEINAAIKTGWCNCDADNSCPVAGLTLSIPLGGPISDVVYFYRHNAAAGQPPDGVSFNVDVSACLGGIQVAPAGGNFYPMYWGLLVGDYNAENISTWDGQGTVTSIDGGATGTVDPGTGKTVLAGGRTTGIILPMTTMCSQDIAPPTPTIPPSIGMGFCCRQPGVDPSTCPPH